ncbi:MAG: GNAT family N-acetyltransferase [Clostridia bacterium]|nr:GNAT family N-acetyltransferase [Clostridia bacterium]
MLYDIDSCFRSPIGLKGERVILRRLTVGDSADMYEYARLESVTRYLLWSPHDSEAHTKKYLKYLQKQYAKGGCFDFAITLPDGKMIGTCGFAHVDRDNNAVEIGYVINPKYQNNGYATEAVALCLDFAFSKLGMHRAYCRILEGNEASRRVCEKNGMVEEAFLRSALLIKGDYRSCFIYSALNNGGAADR